MPIQVVEQVTHNNFNPKNYLLLNKDLHIFKGDAEKAKNHFLKYGQYEKRNQIESEYLEKYDSYRKDKYLKFKDILIGNNNWTFLEEEGRFPIVFSGGHFERENYNSESSGRIYAPFAHEILSNPAGSYMDLGAGLRDIVFENCLYIEVYPSITADVIVPPTCDYPIATDALDAIGCFAVLEHVKYPWKAASEIVRMLKPDGKAFIDWPFLQPVHGYPSHYYNATRQGLELMFAEQCRVEFSRTERSQDAAFTVSWILDKFARDLPQVKRERLLAMSVGELIRQSPEDGFWREMMDGLPDDKYSDLACGNTLCVVKTHPSGGDGPAAGPGLSNPSRSFQRKLRDFGEGILRRGKP